LGDGDNAIRSSTSTSRSRTPQKRTSTADKARLNGSDGTNGTNGARQRLSIVVVDDHRFMREVICAMLSRHAERYNVVGHAASVAEALKVCAETQPDVIVLDVNLPDRSGIEAVPHLKKVSPKSRILLCTAFVSDDRIIDALRSGAQGFVEKTNSWSEFADAVDRVSKGEHYFAARTSALASTVRHDGASPRSTVSLPQLSQRETEVLTLIAHGRTSKEVANDLGISVATVDTHRTNLMSKLQIRNVAGLVVYAFRFGLIKLQEGESAALAS
jgi:DNA-binding NarL/FixJ family response regulator